MKKLALIERKREMDSKLESYISFFCRASHVWAAPKDWMILAAQYRNQLLVDFYNENIKNTILNLFYKKRMKEILIQNAELTNGKKWILGETN